MEFIFNILKTIGSTIASFYAAHPLAAAILTIVAIAVFWSLMEWKGKPDFSDKKKLAKNGLIVLLGWAIAVPILDFIFKIFAKLLEGASLVGKSIGWLWTRFNEQPFVVLICLTLTVVCFLFWKHFSKQPKTHIKGAWCVLGFAILVATAVPIANSLSKEDKQPTKSEVSAPSS